MKFSPKIFGLLIGIMPMFSVAAFGDVSVEDPDFQIFQHLKDVKVMTPFPDGNFHPEKLVTRVEALTIALRAGGIAIPESFDGQTTFNDVDPNIWFAAIIARGVELEFVSTKSQKFYPNRAITKAEFLAFLFRATSVDFRPFFGRTKNIALDIPEESWFAPHFVYAKKYQIAHLPPDGFYRPFKPLSRREVALMTFRQLRIFHGDGVTKDFVELQARIQQFVTLLRAGEPEKAEFHLQHILELSERLALQRNNQNAVAAQAISRAMKHLSESMRAFKFGNTLAGLENLHLATNHAERAAKKSEKIAPFARELSYLIDETLENFTRPKLGGAFR